MWGSLRLSLGRGDASMGIALGIKEALVAVRRGLAAGKAAGALAGRLALVADCDVVLAGGRTADFAGVATRVAAAVAAGALPTRPCRSTPGTDGGPTTTAAAAGRSTSPAMRWTGRPRTSPI